PTPEPPTPEPPTPEPPTPEPPAPAPGEPTITRFVLVDAATDTDLFELEDGMTLNRDTLPQQLNIRAEVSGTVGSVRFGLNDIADYQVENEVPYTLEEDDEGNYRPWTPEDGGYALTATPYSGIEGTGTAYASRTINFVVTSGQQPTNDEPTITRFVLVDAATDADLFELEDGMTLNRDTLPQQLNIRAEVSGAVGSVRFGLNNVADFNTENVAPFALAEDNDSDYRPWTPEDGGYVLTATPFSQVEGGGTAYTARTIRFVISSDSADSTGSVTTNQPPRITASNRSDIRGSVISFQLTATDAEMDALTYITSGLPTGLTVNNSTGLITGTLNAAPGVYPVTIIVSDGVNPAVASTIQWTVTDPAAPSNPQPPAPQPPTPTPQPSAPQPPAPQPPTTSDPSVVRFVVVDANTEQDLFVLTEGMNIDLSRHSSINIRAEVNGTVGSVRFSLNDTANYHVENVAPYALAGDNWGNYRVWTMGNGQYTLTATPYSGADGSGTAYTPRSITFTMSGR
ncbi:MAG: Ig domain-containing protein, partial [Chloroflexota bacterium]